MLSPQGAARGSRGSQEAHLEWREEPAMEYVGSLGDTGTLVCSAGNTPEASQEPVQVVGL